MPVPEREPLILEEIVWRRAHLEERSTGAGVYGEDAASLVDRQSELEGLAVFAHRRADIWQQHAAAGGGGRTRRRADERRRVVPGRFGGGRRASRRGGDHGGDSRAALRRHRGGHRGGVGCGDGVGGGGGSGSGGGGGGPLAFASSATGVLDLRANVVRRAVCGESEARRVARVPLLQAMRPAVP